MRRCAFALLALVSCSMGEVADDGAVDAARLADTSPKADVAPLADALPDASEEAAADASMEVAVDASVDAHRKPSCTSDAQCAPSDHCDLGAGVCAPGCHGDDGCARPTPRCDVAARVCAECIGGADCPSGHRCAERRCVASMCPAGFADCNGEGADGCEVNLATDPMNCGACGQRMSEVCNARDDNCDGRCDDLDGCRVGVHRTSGAEHFYTLSEAEATAAGFRIEARNYFYLMAAAAPGTLPLQRCYRASEGRHFMATRPDCEGATFEGVMGHIASSPICGAVPLYRLRQSSSGDNFYTTSAAERDRAVATLGYSAIELAGYVWAGPRG